MTRGVLMYAYNNIEIDYFKIACANALMVKKNLDVPVTLVTDSGTLAWGKKTLPIDGIFENIIQVKKTPTFNNMRNFSDTTHSVKLLEFYNCNHWQAYELSPYDETLFIDADYLIMSDALNKCWGSVNDVMVNHRIYSPTDTIMPYSRSIDHVGIRLYWATVIYFKKSTLAEHLFSIMRHVQENYSYYRDLYLFSNDMFRNDHAVSIAIHMMNGFGGDKPVIPELPINGMLMCWDSSDIYKINGINDITVYAEKAEATGKYLLSRIKNTDIHVINKWAINRHADDLINLYSDKL